MWSRRETYVEEHVMNIKTKNELTEKDNSAIVSENLLHWKLSRKGRQVVVFFVVFAHVDAFDVNLSGCVDVKCGHLLRYHFFLIHFGIFFFNQPQPPLKILNFPIYLLSWKAIILVMTDFGLTTFNFSAYFSLVARKVHILFRMHWIYTSLGFFFGGKKNEV